MSLGQMAAMWKIPGIGRPAVRPGERLSVDWLKSTPSSQIAVSVADVEDRVSCHSKRTRVIPSRRAQSYDGADGKMLYERQDQAHWGWSHRHLPCAYSKTEFVVDLPIDPSRRCRPSAFQGRVRD
jgi:hypothetical protein